MLDGRVARGSVLLDTGGGTGVGAEEAARRAPPGTYRRTIVLDPQRGMLTTLGTRAPTPPIDPLVRADGRYELTEMAREGPESMRDGFHGAAGPRNPEDAVRQFEAYATFLEELGRSDRGEVPALTERLRSVARRLKTLAQREVRDS